jgi:hypothetical protein
VSLQPKSSNTAVNIIRQVKARIGELIMAHSPNNENKLTAFGGIF